MPPKTGPTPGPDHHAAGSGSHMGRPATEGMTRRKASTSSSDMGRISASIMLVYLSLARTTAPGGAELGLDRIQLVACGGDIHRTARGHGNGYGSATDRCFPELGAAGRAHGVEVLVVADHVDNASRRDRALRHAAADSGAPQPRAALGVPGGQVAVTVHKVDRVPLGRRCQHLPDVAGAPQRGAVCGAQRVQAVVLAGYVHDAARGHGI